MAILLEAMSKLCFKLYNKGLVIRYGKRVSKIGEEVPAIEYYIIDDCVRVRKFTGEAGSYKYIDNRLVKASDSVGKIDDMMLLGWKESNHQGYFDEELDCFISSKAQYRAEMKKQGLIPHEKQRYRKSRDEIAKENIQRAFAKDRKQGKEKFYREILPKMEAQHYRETGKEMDWSKI